MEATVQFDTSLYQTGNQWTASPLVSYFQDGKPIDVQKIVDALFASNQTYTPAEIKFIQQKCIQVYQQLLTDPRFKSAIEAQNARTIQGYDVHQFDTPVSEHFMQHLYTLNQTSLTSEELQKLTQLIYTTQLCLPSGITIGTSKEELLTLLIEEANKDLSFVGELRDFIQLGKRCLLKLDSDMKEKNVNGLTELVFALQPTTNQFILKDTTKILVYNNDYHNSFQTLRHELRHLVNSSAIFALEQQTTLAHFVNEADAKSINLWMEAANKDNSFFSEIRQNVIHQVQIAYPHKTSEEQMQIAAQKARGIYTSLLLSTDSERGDYLLELHQQGLIQLSSELVDFISVFGWDVYYNQTHDATSSVLSKNTLNDLQRITSLNGSVHYWQDYYVNYYRQTQNKYIPELNDYLQQTFGSHARFGNQLAYQLTGDSRLIQVQNTENETLSTLIQNSRSDISGAYITNNQTIINTPISTPRGQEQPFHYALRMGEYKIAMQILQSPNFDYTQTDEESNSPLLAVLKQYVQANNNDTHRQQLLFIAHTLVQNLPRESANQTDQSGRTALYYALGDVELTKMLLATGYHTNHTDNQGQTPLEFVQSQPYQISETAISFLQVAMHNTEEYPSRTNKTATINTIIPPKITLTHSNLLDETNTKIHTPVISTPAPTNNQPKSEHSEITPQEQTTVLTNDEPNLNPIMATSDTSPTNKTSPSLSPTIDSTINSQTKVVEPKNDKPQSGMSVPTPQTHIRPRPKPTTKTTLYNNSISTPQREKIPTVNNTHQEETNESMRKRKKQHSNSLTLPPEKLGFWEKNWKWIVGVAVALATAVGAWFLIRKQKKKTDSAKTEVNKLNTQIQTLQSQVADLTEQKTNNTTLAKNASLVSDTENTIIPQVNEHI